MKLRFLFILLIILTAACNDDDNPVYPEPPVYDMSGFAKGADVSWLTEMERNSKKFYNRDGLEKECMALLRDLGTNSIRLRVWVDPANGWCNKSDLLVKAYRAHNLGMRLMIDFHYSDSWADPGQQTKPSAWAGLTFDELQTAVATHTKDVLGTLKENGITPEWVQVGNETGDGMLWEDGRASDNMANYALLNNAGYDAVKEIFPEAKVIVHLQNGQENSLFRWLFDGLKNNGGKWDVIGMSLYPPLDEATGEYRWQEWNNNCIANANDMISRYGSEVMICEVGMPWNEGEASKAFLTDLIEQAKAVADGKCLGIFYWEPQSYGNWNGYTMGAFNENGQPTEALEAYK